MLRRDIASRESRRILGLRGASGVVLLRCSRRRTAMERNPAPRVRPAWLGLGDKTAMV